MRMQKRGQITLFVIIAIVIIGALIIFFSVSNTGKGLVDRVTGAEFDPYASLVSCVENNNAINPKISEILVQGGDSNPQHFALYKNNKLKYLCYTNQFYDRCVMQEPFVLQKTEKEIQQQTQKQIESCVEELKSQLNARGYSSNFGRLNYSASIVPDNIILNIGLPLSISRGETSKNYQTPFEVRKKSEAYNLIMIANSILNFEARYGAADIGEFMALYPDIRIEAQKQTDGSVFYLLSSRSTEEQFSFAVRSVAFPPGYGL